MDVILINLELGDIVLFIDLFFKINRKMNENLIWGVGYNFIVILIVVGILVLFGIILLFVIGGVLMLFLIVIVVFNVLSLKMIKF